MKITKLQLRRILKEELFKELNIKEAIVDVVAEKLSDVFEGDKLKPEVSNVIKDGIKKLSQWLKQAHPDMRVSEVFIVGAAVTYQYGPGSDIDISVVIDGVGDKKGEVYQWLKANLKYPNFEGEGSSRPYQFVPMADNAGYRHVDAAYDPYSDRWTKAPDLSKAKEMYKSKVGGEGSKEREAYKKLEANYQREFKALYDLLETSTDPEELYAAIKETYQRKGDLKKMRGMSFEAGEDLPGREKGGVEKGYVSQNWGFTNVLYKMLDREGYLDVFKALEPIVKNKALVQDESAIAKVKAAIDKVKNDPIGWGGARY
tara:strand:- start:664 stop:1608 length:945 start_codon:yes stop_codon:yes gene_type:complete